MRGEEAMVRNERGDAGGLIGSSGRSRYCPGQADERLDGGRYVIPNAWCRPDMSRLAGIHVTVTSPQEPWGKAGGRGRR